MRFSEFHVRQVIFCFFEVVVNAIEELEIDEGVTVVSASTMFVELSDSRSLKVPGEFQEQIHQKKQLSHQ